MREYRAFWDDGHDTGSFEFWSDYRAGSKGNLDDAKKEYATQYGQKRLRRVTIETKCIYLV